MRVGLVIVILSLAACQVQKKQELSYKSLPIYLPEFNNYIKDNTPLSKARTEAVLGEADYIYYHILKKFIEADETDIVKLVECEAPFEKLLNEPTKYRGKTFMVYGKILDLYNSDTAHIGTIVSGDQPVVFHLAEKPDVVYLGSDNISFEGVFIKLLKSKDKRIPFFMAKTLKRL